MAQFILALIVGLALLTWAATNVVETTARGWFERDVNSRAELVLVGASQSLANNWYGDSEIQKQLLDISRDERVIGAALCDADLTPRFSTPGFPEEFRCSTVGRRVRTADADGNAGRLQEWSTVATLPTGRVHVSVMPITNQNMDLGFAILVHDLSFIERRESQARTFMFIASGFLAIMAFGVPLFVAKWSRYGWSLELRNLLRGTGKHNREFQPILSDVRELVGRMANDRENAPGLWTAERLKQTLNRHLHGEKIVILANREPYIHEFTEDGRIEVQHPASGLVTALEPVMHACSGVWVAHGSGSADRATVDRRARLNGYRRLDRKHSLRRNPELCSAGDGEPAGLSRPLRRRHAPADRGRPASWRQRGVARTRDRRGRTVSQLERPCSSASHTALPRFIPMYSGTWTR